MRAVWISVAQALVTGLSFGILAGALAWATGIGTPFEAFIVVAAFTQAIAWIALMIKPALQGFEVAVNKDVNKDGIIGSKPKVVIEEKSDDSRQIIRHHIRATNYQFLMWAKGIMDGETIAEDRWTGKGRPFSRAQYHAFREDLIKNGWIRPINEKTDRFGYELTRQGEAVVTWVALQPLPPRPEPKTNGV